jgi:hypothetical protein
MRALTLCTLAVTTTALAACGSSERANVRSAASTAQSQTVPQKADTKIDPSVPASVQAERSGVDAGLEPIADEFRKRLVAFGGELQRIGVVNNVLQAAWSSNQCEMVEGEIIDFLISINRGHPGELRNSIQATRTCDGQSREFRLSSKRFKLYRDGQINDPAVLTGLQ